MQDYNHPVAWESMTDYERSKWYTEERCRRQALGQNTRFSRMMRSEIERLKRKAKADPDTVSLSDWR